MKENFLFLEERLHHEGKTNLGVYFLKFKEEQNQSKTSGLMIPPAGLMIPPVVGEKADQPPMLAQPVPQAIVQPPPEPLQHAMS